MCPGHWSAVQTRAPAVIDAANGFVLTWAELDVQSKRIARWLAGRGLVPGDHVALFMKNHLQFFAVCWATLRSGPHVYAISADHSSPQWAAAATFGRGGLGNVSCPGQALACWL
ncbi:MAG: AMP-binding protein [Gammaproteobacteria bacterium]|nr:AMP-binding protein [Gammaproteobacteria bacterium]